MRFRAFLLYSSALQRFCFKPLRFPRWCFLFHFRFFLAHRLHFSNEQFNTHDSEVIKLTAILFTTANLLLVLSRVKFFSLLWAKSSAHCLVVFFSSGHTFCFNYPRPQCSSFTFPLRCNSPFFLEIFST